MTLDVTNQTATTLQPHKLQPVKSSKETAGFGFSDILDAVNPLQHVPIVSQIYRSVTGDTLSSLSQITGGALYGGVTGAISSVANVFVEQATGSNVTEHVMQAFSQDNEKTGYESLPATALTHGSPQHSPSYHTTATPVGYHQLQHSSSVSTQQGAAFVSLLHTSKETEIQTLGLENAQLQAQLSGQMSAAFVRRSLGNNSSTE